MRKENTFFSKLFGAKGGSAEKSNPTPVALTSYSQPHVLRQRMREENMSHGQTVTANLSPVRLESAPDRMILYFCPMKSIEVLRVMTDGDGGNIPVEAKVDGLTTPENFEDGFYTLKNVVLTSNGTIQVRATEDTVWEKAKYECF